MEEHKNSHNSPYKFNGKELDEESGLYYYGVRYYDPRISIWASLDPLANFNPFMDDEFYIDGDHNGGVFNHFNHNSYGYCYQNPVNLVDPNGKQTVAELASGYKIDMNNAPQGSNTNAKGFKSNGPWFWRQVRNSHPEMFSEINKKNIAKGKSPIVDDTWVKHNPSSANYMKDKLVHHHIDQGRFAVGIPEQAHVGMTKQLHNRSASWFKSNGLGKTLNSISFLFLFVDIYKIMSNHPDALFSTFNPDASLNTLQGITPSDPIEWMFSGNYYYEIKSKDSKTGNMMLKFYNSFENDKNGNYRGVGEGSDYSATKNKDGSFTLEPIIKS
ncbi:RHS repeat-associated core domain-containing protein [Flavobacterium branchiophilum]|uniref:RHS repeat-associated core domain-containing protein n=1 Tax=Flavobacterium branchiophilum TaxID=55197 RepID=UPI001CBB51CB|nr:RHS repeat-associated core domain-containing protein [Flavobacterium branchiophilum]